MTVANRILFYIVLSLLGFTGCCPVGQGDVRSAAMLYYTTGRGKINSNIYSVDMIRVINVRKHSCDSLSVYVRVTGTYASPGNKVLNKFNQASRLTMLRRSEIYEVIKEQAEE